jgi:glycosyltransferase involved in cell wall biosynthesis
VPKVVILAYHYPPIGGGGVQRTLKFTRYLPDLGWETSVVTGLGSSDDRWAPRDPSMATEIPAEVTVARLVTPEAPDQRGLDRLVARALARPPAMEAHWVTGARSVGRTVASGADVILGELVPYSTAVAAAALSREVGVPWVADLQDPWALDEMWMYPSALHRALDRRRMRRLLATSSGIVMNTPEAARRIRAVFPELSARVVEAIPNGYDAADFAGPPPPRDASVFRIVHTGYLHTDTGLRHRKIRGIRKVLGGMPVQGVDFLSRSHVFLLQAVDEMIRLDPSLESIVEIHLAGVMTEADRLVSRRSRATVVDHGYVTHARSVELLRAADLLFLPMHDLPPGVRAGLVPGKTYEYLASGTPILAAVPHGDARDLLLEAGTAAVCDPTDVLAMISHIRARMCAWREGTPPQPAPPDVIGRYERRALTVQLVAVLERAAGSSRLSHLTRG